MPDNMIYTIIKYDKEDSCWDCGASLECLYRIIATFTDKDIALSEFDKFKDNDLYHLLEYKANVINDFGIF